MYNNGRWENSKSHLVTFEKMADVQCSFSMQKEYVEVNEIMFKERHKEKEWKLIKTV